MYFLSTPRIGFRHWSKDDIVLATTLWGDPEVTHFIDARSPLYSTQIREKLDAELETQRQHGMQYWPIFLVEDGKHVGCCGLRPKDAQSRIFEFGVHLRTSYWGTGIAAEAGRTAVDYAFEHLMARQLFAGHHPENHASRRLLERLGFVYIGDQLYPPTGLEHPSYMLVRTTSD
ncbi:putative N-acetyltransferase p20 [Hyphodiscus hymeniophilus]|uniref:N-acetyltransferase p20 n=1 Tax=Hyphodiscus hymeniophilus TaxID=353542 RepID=A0A9P6SQ63_9HELO|nr:putative N-acetyltransferase p20 [Hyphodiscus hymeniophilus]